MPCDGRLAPFAWNHVAANVHSSVRLAPQGDTSMRLRSFVLAALMVVLGGLGGITRAQYPPMGGPGGPYGMAGGMPGPSPYAPSAFAPAGYAGMGGPGPMGAPMGPP